MPDALNILSGGAARGLVLSLASEFKAVSGLAIEGEFGAVGTMADKLRGGTPADLVILTAAIITKLAEENLVILPSKMDIGLVETALAVRSGDAQVNAKDAATLRAAFLAADEIFIPDTTSSTAGIHIAKVLSGLGVAEDVADRLKVFPNGTTAMRYLATSTARRPLGCTQVTEIVSTTGVMLSGSLPPGCDLTTVYTAAVVTKAVHAEQARVLIRLLTGADQSALRIRAGFVGSSG